MQTHRFPPMSSLLLFITMIFVCSPTPLFAIDDERYLNCSALFTCGNIQKIGYPFWGSGRSSYCGYPGFELDCRGQTTVITIEKLNYHVLDIDPITRTLTVVRTDYAGNICPSRLSNSTLDTNLFTFTPEAKNITLYYDCPTITASRLPNDFYCNKSNNIPMSGYYLAPGLSILGSFANNISTYLGSCGDTVIVQADELAIQSLEGNPNEENLIDVVDKGFGLRWDRNDSWCSTCQEFGGQCGHNPSTLDFACYCWDQPYDFHCGRNAGRSPNQSGASGKSDKVRLGVGLGIAGAAIAGVFLGGWLVIIRRKRKIPQTKSEDLQPPPSTKGLPSSTNFSSSIPSYPSSRLDLEKGSTYFGVQMFTSSELEKATNNFDSSRELGDGGFGVVYYGLLSDGRAVAIKRLYENNMKRAEQFMNEVDILARLRHRNLVTLYGCTSRRSRELLLVYEYIPNGTVADHVHGKKSKSGSLTWPVRLSIAIETADALVYLHSSDIIHRDVKTNNILVDKNFQVKVADFGLSRLFPNDVTHVSTAPQGTPGYVDPEYYQCYQLTDKSDVYSFGVVLVELISSLQAVDTNRQRHDINLANMAVNKIQNHQLHEMVDPCLGFEDDCTVRTMITSVAIVAFRCLQRERDMRPTMEEVLKDLRRIQSEKCVAEKAEVVDIREDDVGLLNHVPPPVMLSPDSVTDKWVSSSSITTPNSV